MAVRKIRINEAFNNYDYIYCYQSLEGPIVFDKVEDAKNYAIDELNKLLDVPRTDKKTLYQYIDNINNSFSSNGFYGDGHSIAFNCYKIKHYT